MERAPPVLFIGDDVYFDHEKSDLGEDWFRVKTELVRTIADQGQGVIDGSQRAKDRAGDPGEKLREATATLRDEFKAAVGKGGTQDILYAQRLGTVANSLPGVTKGILSAKNAFAQGDAIGGSAAIMDIVAAAAPGLGVLAALGPEGAAVGALFSMFGLIISAFEEKQPSVADQIKDTLKDLDAESQKIGLGAIQHSLEVSKEDLEGVYKNVAAALALEVNTLELKLQFETLMGAATIATLTKRFEAIVTEFRAWEVANWLKSKEKQQNRQWPEVLAIWCRSYLDIVATNTKFNCSIDLAALAKKAIYFDQKQIPLVDEHGKPNGEYFNDTQKGELHKLCADMLKLAKNARDHNESVNKIALEFLAAVTPVAQRCGRIVRLALPDNGLHLYSAQLNHDDDLSHVKPAGVAIARAGSGTYDLKPRYHWFLYSRSDALFTYWLFSPETPNNRVVSEQSRIIANIPGVTDMCAAQVGENQAALWVGTADGVWRHSWVTDPRTNRGVVTKTEKVVTPPFPVEYVRIAKPAGLDRPMVYAGRNGPPLIRVNVEEWGKESDVESPWRYTGIAADSRYVWVFHPRGFACATHASVLAWVKDRKSRPKWMEYRVPGWLINWDELPHEGFFEVDGAPLTKHLSPPEGLISMSPCDDGTICASIVFREAREAAGVSIKYWAIHDRKRSYTTTFSVDATAGTLTVGEWTPIKDTQKNTYVEAAVVHKLPIGCWPLLESLKATLQFATK